MTTTPRPVPHVKALLDDPSVAVVRGSTYENRPHLAPAFFDQIIRRYEGTRLGEQEIHAGILDDVPGAQWTRDLLEATRVREVPLLRRVVVAIDPAVSSSEEAGETGIVVGK